MSAFQDITGKRFSRLLVLYYEGVGKWVCQCDCGRKKAVAAGNMKSGFSTSCGCFQKELTVARSTKHGSGSRNNKTPEYKTWKGMRRRVLNPNNAAYPRYGGRGISICDRWKDNFDCFLADMGVKPSPRHSIERRDNDGDYCPENCYWATPTEQNRNTCRSRKIDYKGQSKTVAEWAEITGMAYMTLFTRVYRTDMTVEQAMETPIGGKPL